VRGGWGAILQNLAVPGRRQPEFANRQNVCYVKRRFPVNSLLPLGLGPRSAAR
jgi:hypothetical protein